MPEEYLWYKVLENDEALSQGDFVKECPIVIPPNKPEEGKESEIRIINYNVVVMSQSCDLMYRKLNLVLVCPFWELNEFEKANPSYKDVKIKEGLRRGLLPGYHLLNKCEIEGFETDYLVVDFRTVYGVYFDVLLDLVKKINKRLRLLPPYREHLSQAFARFFMRVGLPVEIPQFSRTIF
jgi:hypothetical protein